MKKFTSNWLGRSLKNYKAVHADLARTKDIYVKFMAVKTLTAAKKILFGEKRKHYSCCTDGCGFVHCPRATHFKR